MPLCHFSSHSQLKLAPGPAHPRPPAIRLQPRLLLRLLSSGICLGSGGTYSARTCRPAGWSCPSPPTRDRTSTSTPTTTPALWDLPRFGWHLFGRSDITACGLLPKRPSSSSPCPAGLITQPSVSAPPSGIYSKVSSRSSTQCGKRKQTPGNARLSTRPPPTPRPRKLKKSPAPWFHCASKAARKELIEAYGWFLAAYQKAAHKLRTGELDVAFPEGSFPPPLPFVGETPSLAPT